MAVSMQVAYPITKDTNFDIDYYIEKHLAIIKENWTDQIQTMIVTKGLSGGKDIPSPYYAIATIVFADKDKMREAMKKGGPVFNDIGNYYNISPITMIGEVIG
jgi:uncharacterized protein (TIGR02118 family)